MKKFNLKVLAASILVGFAGVSSTAQADSILAPLVIADIATGWYTVFSLKARGLGLPSDKMANLTDIHYTWRRKSGTLGGMFTAPAQGCTHLDGTGKISSWDTLTHTADPFLDFIAKTPGSDGSSAFTPHGIFTTNFYGYTVISDVANLSSATEEGNLSGEVAVYNVIGGIMLDYKMLNNHKSSDFGDFKKGFTAKTSVDFQWNPINRDVTFWLGLATGPDMVNGNYGAVISQNAHPNGSDDPKIPHNLAPNTQGGVYDNDEVNYSGNQDYAFNCMSAFTLNEVVQPAVIPFVANGGWARKSIVGSGGATGAMIYKAALKFVPIVTSGVLNIAFTSETSGHLNRGFDGKTHANRPY